MAKKPEFEILYKIFQDFLNLCILEDRSLLWPDRNYWTPENVTAVKEKIVNHPLYGVKLSFFEKLSRQMEGTSSQHWGLVADIYYIYLLMSCTVSLAKKQNGVRTIAEKGGLIIPSDNSPLWEGQRHGFTGTGQKFNIKAPQICFIIRFSKYIKGTTERNKILSDPKEFQKALDSTIEGTPTMERTYDMRHGFLYLSFPDSYERIISTQDKKGIIENYRSAIDGPVPDDIDEAIRKIRMSLSNKYDKPDRPFDFYTELKHEWKPGKKVQVVNTDDGPVTVPLEDNYAPPVIPESDVTEHTRIQWLLLKLGNDMGLDVWAARNDRNREVDGHKFSSLTHFKKEIPLSFDEGANRTIELIDVLWLKGNQIKAAFEIESTTSIYSGILRLADLIAMQPNINFPLYLVAPDDRREKVISEVTRPVFSKLPRPMSEVCKFIPFSNLRKKIPEMGNFVRFLSPDFLDDLSEPCEIEGDL